MQINLKEYTEVKDGKITINLKKLEEHNIVMVTCVSVGNGTIQIDFEHKFKQLRKL